MVGRGLGLPRGFPTSGADLGRPSDRGASGWKPALVDALPDAVLAVDRAGQIVYANAAAAALFGYTEVELARTPLEALLPEGLRKAHAAHRAGYMDAPTPRAMRTGVRFPGRRKDGRPLSLEIMLSPASGRDGEPLAVCVVRDLTEGEAHATEVERANRALRVLSAGNTALIKSQSERELVERVCRAACDSGGYAMAWIGRVAEGGAVRVLAKSGHDDGYIAESRPTLAGDDRTGSPVNRAMRTGKPVYERGIGGLRSDAPWLDSALRRGFRSVAAFPLHDGERVSGCFAIYSKQADAFDWKEGDLLAEMADDLAFGLRTIHQKAANEAEIRRISEMLTTAQRIGKVGSWDWNIVEDDAVWSDEMARIFGFEPGQGGGDLAHAMALMHPEDKDRVGKAVADALEGRAPYEINYRIVRSDGDVRHIYAIGEVLRDASGKPARMIGSVQDVTAAHMAERTREEMLDVISHALRTPVTVIQGYAMLLATGMEGLEKEQLDEIQGRIEKASLHISVLMTSVAELVKLRDGGEPAETAPEAVEDVVADALEILEIKHPGWGERIRRHVGDGTPPLLTNRRRMALALEEVMDNALRYSPEDEVADVRVTAAGGGRVRIDVSDRGPGLSPQVVENLGTPFTSVEVPTVKRVGGAGLGFAIAGRMARSVGGTMTAAPREGGGTTVTFDLPAAPAAPAA